MRIERIVDATDVAAGAGLFDDPPKPDATAQFLSSPGHHLLFAYDDVSDPGSAGDVVGFVSGVEMTHPDKGAEMFIYELSVAQQARRRGVATALLRALAEVAVDHGCSGMWVAVDVHNYAALATYRKAGASEEDPAVVLSWDLAAPS